MARRGRKRGGTRKSLKNPVLYDELRSEGKSKRQAARISNGVLLRGVRKARNHSGKRRRK